MAEEPEEIEVTEIIERLEKLEKEIGEIARVQKENSPKNIQEIEKRLIECENSIDAIAEKLRGQ